MTKPVEEIHETFGLWERSLLAWPDGRQDTTTFAAWLQGPTLFADLRQPMGAPAFDGVTCLDGLEPEHVHWLARQEGFAGRLVRAGEAFEWQRMVDFQCPSASTDAGYLAFSEGVLVEQGRDIPYIEHWHLTATGAAPHFAVRMHDADACLGFLVRAGAAFMYVRDRRAALPYGGMLPDLVEASSPQDARAFLDCEISFGFVEGTAWRVARSSLPYRVGADLAPRFTHDRTALTTADVARDGTALARAWTIVEFDAAQPQKNTIGQGNDQDFPSLQPATGRAS